MTDDQRIDEVLARSRAVVQALRQAKADLDAEIEKARACNPEARRMLDMPTADERQLRSRMQAELNAHLAAVAREAEAHIAMTRNVPVTALKKRRPRVMV